MNQKTPTHPKIKRQYVPPAITTYSASKLMRQLGPARAFSGGRSLDDELLGLDY